MGLVITPEELARSHVATRPAHSSRRRPVAAADQRWKREEGTYVKHDKLFSDWKILVGPEDWKAHAAGKEDIAAERYRAHNLPGSNGGPGVYELGVCTMPAECRAADVNEQQQHRIRLQKSTKSKKITKKKKKQQQQQKKERKLKPQNVMVVYVGNAEHIRHRLQRYGETGGHLEGSRSTRLFVIKPDDIGLHAAAGSSSWKSKCELQTTADDAAHGVPERSSSSKSSRAGPRLFSEVFALGCAIAFRWTATDSKSAAENATAELLEVFDYAWNRGGNGSRRSREVLEKTALQQLQQQRPPPSAATAAAGSRRCHCFGTKTRSMSTWPLAVLPSFFNGSGRSAAAVAGINISSARKPTDDDQSHRRQLETVAGSSSSSWSRRISTTPCFKSSWRSTVRDFLLTCCCSPRGPHLLPVLGAGHTRAATKNFEFTKLDIPIERCGALLDTGLPCNALPIRGRKRCLIHKDLKTTKRRGSSKKKRQLQQGHAAATITTQQTIRNSELQGRSPQLQNVGHHGNTRAKATSQLHETAAAASDVMEDLRNSPARPSFQTMISSCLPSRLLPAAGMTASTKHECKTQEVKTSARVSLSFSTWLKTSRGIMTETDIIAADAAAAAAAAAITLKTAASTDTNNNIIFSKIDLEGLQNEDFFELIVQNIYGSQRCGVLPPITHTMLQRNCPLHYSMHAEIGI